MSELLAKLTAVGELEARGEFSIDAEKAREKLRHYQLADPYRYVLLLVEAAVCSGAETLSFEIDTDDLHLRFAGRAFKPRWLENIYSALFLDGAGSKGGEHERQSLRAAQLLACGLNSAMALNPRWIRMTSVGPGGEGAGLELRPDRADSFERLEGAAPGTHIHVRDRLRPGLLVEFVQSLQGRLVEAELLRAACTWAQVEIRVDGARISTALDGPGFGGPMMAGAWWREPIVVDGQVLGAGVLVAGSEHAGVLGLLLPPVVEVLSNGVYADTIDLQRAVLGFLGIVDARGLHKDASQNKILREANFDVLMRAVSDCHDALISRLARHSVQPGYITPDYTHAVLRDWLGTRRWDDLRTALDDGGETCLAAVADVELWQAVGGSRLSTRALAESSWPIRYTTEVFKYPPAEVEFALYCREDDLTLLSALFGSQISDYSATLRRLHEQEERRLEFMARRHAPVLPPGDFLVVESILSGDESTLIGEIGLRGGGAGGTVRLLTQGALLQESVFDDEALSLPGLCIVVSAELEANRGFDAARPNAALAEVLMEVLAAVERMIRKLALRRLEAMSGADRKQDPELRPDRGLIDAILRRYMVSVTKRDFERDFLERFGFRGPEARRYVYPRPGRVTRPQWGLDRVGVGGLHPLTQVPLYAQVGGPPLSLAALQAQVLAGGPVAWLDVAAHSAELLKSLDLGRTVLRIGRAERAVLREILGDQAVESFAGEIVRLRERGRFLARDETAVDLGRRALVWVPIGGGGTAFEGQLGLERFGPEAVGGEVLAIDVFHRGRPLCEVEQDLPLPGLVAWVEGGEAEVAPSYDALAAPSAVFGPVLEGVVELVGVVLGRAEADPTQLGECEWWFLIRVVTLLFGARQNSLMPAYLSLAASGGPTSAKAELGGLLGLLEGFPARDLTRVLARLRSADRRPSAAAAGVGLKRPSARVRSAEQRIVELRVGLLTQLPRLLELPLLWSWSELQELGVGQRRRWSLGALIERIGGGEPLAWVERGFQIRDPPEVDASILAVDAIERSALYDLFGAEALEDMGPWLSGRAGFERRRKIGELRIPSGAAVVALRIQEEGVRGELGIARDPETTRTRIRIVVEGRELTTLDLPGRPLSLVGVVEFDSLQVTADHRDLPRAEQKRVWALTAKYEGALLDALVAGYAELRRPRQKLVAAVVMATLLRWPGGRDLRTRARRPRLRDRFAVLAALPVFPGARKPWSALELAEASERGPIMTLEYRRAGSLPEGPVVVLDRPQVEAVVRALFGRTHDLTRERARLARLEARRAAAPELDREPPRGALSSVRIREQGSEGFEGWLAIAAGDMSGAKVALGEQGRQMATDSLLALFPCVGAVWGAGLDVEQDWTRATLSRGQRRLLERRAAELWLELIATFERLNGDRSPRDLEGRRRYVAIRKALQGLFMRLHAELGRRYRKRVVNGRRPSNRNQGIYARCCALRLLELGSGRWISADTATRERPIELAQLELWRGLSAEELSHRRAVEQIEERRRRVAERVKKLERARRNERERRQLREREARERDRERDQERDREQKAGDLGGAPATPELLLLEALREELRLVRGERGGLASDLHLDALELGSADKRRAPLFSRAPEGGPRINPRHPLFRGVLERYMDDPAWLSLLASSVYTYLNFIHEVIEDRHEAHFLREHAAYLASVVAD